MSKHRVVKSDFWVDEYVEDLPINERYFFLYLLTCPESNILGIFKTTMKRMSFETTLLIEEIERMFEKFSSVDKIHYIDGYVLLVNFQKHQNPSGTMKTGISKLLNDLPKSVIDFILSKKSKIYDRLYRGYLIDYIYPYKDKDINIDKSTNKNPNQKKQVNSQNFELFWSEYPKKKAKGQAEKAFNKINADPDLLNKIIEAIKEQKKSLDWQKDNGQFIPFPATWLNGKRWEDSEYEAKKTEFDFL